MFRNHEKKLKIGKWSHHLAYQLSNSKPTRALWSTTLTGHVLPLFNTVRVTESILCSYYQTIKNGVHRHVTYRRQNKTLLEVKLFYFFFSFSTFCLVGTRKFMDKNVKNPISPPEFPLRFYKLLSGANKGSKLCPLVSRFSFCVTDWHKMFLHTQSVNRTNHDKQSNQIYVI